MAPKKITASYVAVARAADRARRTGPATGQYVCDCGQMHRQSAERCARCKRVPVPVSDAWVEGTEP